MTRHHSSRRAGIALLAVAAITTLAGCTPGEDTAPDPSASVAQPSGSARPTASPAAPAVFHQGGTAAENLPIFTKVVNDVWKSGKKAEGRAYIDALVAVGFTDKKAMQVTKDRSTIDEPAESIQFSILVGKECLIGQVGPATGTPVTRVEAPISATTCLIGPTRKIDW